MANLVTTPTSESLWDGLRSGFKNAGGINPVAEAMALLRLLTELIQSVITAITKGRFPVEELIRQTWYAIKVCTLPALAVSIPFGVILSLQVGILTKEVGALSFSGAGNAFAVIRQAAPMITALMLAGVAGSAICADLGSRKIREELDALEVMGIPVVERLLMPRMLATVIVSVLLNGIVMFFAIITTLLVGVVFQDLPAGSYLASVSSLAQPTDILLSLSKAAVFGVICTLVAGYKGLNVKHGPAGVGDAVTSSVVMNFIMLFGANFAISQLYALISTGPFG